MLLFFQALLGRYHKLDDAEQADLMELEEDILGEIELRALSVFGSAYAEVSVTQNSTDIRFSGPSRNMAETIGRGTSEKVKLFTMVGNDSLGEQLKKNLLENRVITTFIGTDQKSPTATTVRLTLPNKILSQQSNITVLHKQAAEQSTVVQYNHDTVFKTNYKYLYPNQYFMNDSDAILTDLLINQNALKHLIGAYGPKLFIDAANNSQQLADVLWQLYNQHARNKRFSEAPAAIAGMLLQEAEADKMLAALCHRLTPLGAGGPKVLQTCPTVANYSLETIVASMDQQTSDSLSSYMQTLHLLAKTQLLVIKTSRGFLHSFFYENSILQTWLAEYPPDVPAHGSAEDFFACYVIGTQKLFLPDRAANFAMGCYAVGIRGNMSPKSVNAMVGTLKTQNTLVGYGIQGHEKTPHPGAGADDNEWAQED